MSLSQVLLLACATGLYVLSALIGLLGLRRQAQSRGAWRAGTLAAALLLHTAFLLSRGLQTQSLPTETRLDSFALFLWVAAAVFVAASRPYQLRGVAPFFWSLFAVAAVGMWALASREPAPRGSLGSLWLCLHVVPLYVGYAGFATAAASGMTYLLQEQFLRRKVLGTLWRLLPSLETLERVDRVAMSLGFPMATVGLVAGALWAGTNADLLGRGWYADPKVLGGAVVWLFYAAIVHVRLFARLRGRRAAWLTIAGFILALASFATVHVFATAPERAEKAGYRSHAREQAVRFPLPYGRGSVRSRLG